MNKHKIIRALVIGYMTLFAVSLMIILSSLASLMLYKLISLI
jgi:hypothetical protein